MNPGILIYSTNYARFADRIVPNRNPLIPKFPVRPANVQPRRSPASRYLQKLRGACGLSGTISPRVSLSSVLFNWAGLVALWALPYLTVLDHLHLDVAHSEVLQWSLLFIGVLGLVSLIGTAWKDTLDPEWRAKHGLTLRKRAGRPHTENTA